MVRSSYRINLDFVIPVLVIPSAILIATLGPIATKFVFISVPCGLFCFYRTWSRPDSVKPRTRLFFAWTATSAVFMYSVYMVIVVGFREVLLWETMIVTTMFGVTVTCFRCTKRNPGVVRRPENELQQIWEDGYELEGGVAGSFCSECRIKRPPRTDHCALCKTCVQGLDHHCLWIDSCIGAYNHRSFILTLISCIVTASYGSHLALTTICTPEMYGGWFLWPTDCRYVYSDILNAVIYVSTCYTCLCVFGLCFILLKQVLLISQNVLARELELATARGLTRFWWIVVDSRLDGSVLENWREFLSSRRIYHRPSSLTEV